MAVAARVSRILFPDGREEGESSQATREIPASVNVNDARPTTGEDGDAGWTKVGPRRRQQNRSTHHVGKANNASIVHSQDRAEKEASNAPQCGNIP